MVAEIKSVYSRAGALPTEWSECGLIEVTQDWELLEQRIHMLEYDFRLGTGKGVGNWAAILIPRLFKRWRGALPFLCNGTSLGVSGLSDSNIPGPLGPFLVKFEYHRSLIGLDKTLAIHRLRAHVGSGQLRDIVDPSIDYDAAWGSLCYIATRDQ